MDLLLTRTARSADGTFGRLEAQRLGPEFPPALTLVTMEDDWKDNAPRESCIPAGTYVLRRTVYQKHGYETFEVTGVPNRSRILIHPANTEEDVEGCIGVGLRFGRLRVPDEDDPSHLLVEKQAAVASREAFRRLMELLVDQDELRLEVVWAEGVAP